MRRLLAGCVLAGLLMGVTGCGPGGLLIRPVPRDMQLEETVLESEEAFFVTHKIALIDVDGFLVNGTEDGFFGPGDNPVAMFVEKLARAREDKKVKAVVLRINSPGGTVGATDALHHALADFREQSGKPVVACLLDVAASGGYYLASGADGIMAQPSTLTGSIGTIMQTVSFAGTMTKLGISAEAIKSGQLKDMASPLRDLREEERAILQGIVNTYYEQFVEAVLAGREKLKREELLPMADGRVFTAATAQEYGLIDRIGYPQDGWEWAKEMAGLEKATLVMYHRPYVHAPNMYAGASWQPPRSVVEIEWPRMLRSGTHFLYYWEANVPGE